MQFGIFEIVPFVERKFKLDGGSMFGIVPKKIWGRLLPVDEYNLIPMETNLFLLKAHDKIILLDTGFGNCISDKEMKIYAAEGETNIETGLEVKGLTTDDIDYVFLSHLHTDHAGGAVKKENGKFVPRFEYATYWVQKREWEDGINPNERTAAVYMPERLRALKKADQLELIDGDKEVMPGIKIVHTGGHTPGHQAIEITSRDITVVYYADIIPSSHHVKVPYVAAVDLDPLKTMDVKRAVIGRLLENNGMIAFDHDINIKIGHLSRDNDKILVNKVE